MKKIIPFLCATIIFSSPLTAFASTNERGTDIEVKQSNEVETKSEGEEASPSIDVISELTLDDVITRGIETSKSLKTLQLNIEILKNEVKITRSGKKAAELRLENGVEQLKQQEESVKQGLTTSYFDLLLLKEQIDLQKRALPFANSELEKNYLFYKHGKLTNLKLQEINKSKEDKEKQLSDMEKIYQTKLFELCSNIGIAYDPEIELQPVQFEVEPIELPTDVDGLVENSNRVKLAAADLDAAKSERRKVKRDNDASKYEKENQDYYVEIAEQNLVSAKEEVQRAIEQLFLDAEQSYLTYQERLKQVENKKKELEELQLLYKLGRVSNDEFEKAQLGIVEIELEVYQSEVQNYLMKQAIEALQKGII